MIFELISLIIQLSTQKDRQPTSRRMVGPPVVILCPTCQEIRLAHEAAVEVRGPGSGWVRAHYLYSCNVCRRDFQAELFENDGSGVLAVRNWTCPSCRKANSLLVRQCPGCGYQAA